MTDNKSSAGRKNPRFKRNTENYEQIPSCTQKKRTKFTGKIPENLENENYKQKVEVLITKRTDITYLFGRDWMKKFKKQTIGRIQLAKNNQ